MSTQAPAEQTWDPAVDPVLCSPYDPPDRHWKLDAYGQAVRNERYLEGRRAPVSIKPINVPADTKSPPTLFEERRIPNKLVLNIREAVAAWRQEGYPGATATTLRLLHHWTDHQAMKLRPFFAQVEAAETFIWLREVVRRDNALRAELSREARHHNDNIVRLCAKMATGTGKTAVMGMVIAWQTLNAANSTRRRNIQHTDRFVVFAPGHTVRERLGVLLPSHPENVYDEMGLVPQDMRARLNRAKVRVVNFQAFTQKELIDDSTARKFLRIEKGTDTESWEAAVRRVLSDIISDQGNGICVINDEAHHCYRPPPRKRANTEQKDEDTRASVWFNAIGALRDMGALGAVDPDHGQAHPVLDFSATPLWIDTASKQEPEQFQWVSSDFGLMDAIESGLVKVPRVPIDDDGRRDETIWRRLYANTPDKNLAEWFAAPRATGDLPQALGAAVSAVVQNWERTLEAWQGTPPPTGISAQTETFIPSQSQPTPPVLIFVVNNIKNATALYEYLAGREDENGVRHPGAYPELSNVDEHGNWHAAPRTLVVHSKIAEADTIPPQLKKLLVEAAGLDSQKDAEAAVREMLRTVGKPGQAGAQVRCVVSVSMLTEGWDARTVTHIVGFRAFSTQLLCEQVTGRALRRTSYDAFREPDPDGRQRLEAEYADVVGIPFEFMPSVDEQKQPGLPKPRTRVHSIQNREHLRVSWPQVVEYQRVAPQNRFVLEFDRVAHWTPRPSPSATTTTLGGVAGEHKEISRLSGKERQRTFQIALARYLVDQLAPAQGGEPQNQMAAQKPDTGRTSLFRSSFTAVKQWVDHPAIDIEDLWDVLRDEDCARNASDAILGACSLEDGGEVRRRARLGLPPVSSTENIDFLTTLHHIAEADDSELSHAACHSSLEFDTARALDAHPEVLRWARNFQLGWTIPYYREGVWRRYEPDFVAVLKDGTNLIVECKGVWDDKAEAAKDYAIDHWIPCVAGTTDLPDNLRRWHYGVIDNPESVRFQLNEAIADAINNAQAASTKGQ